MVRTPTKTAILSPNQMWQTFSLLKQLGSSNCDAISNALFEIGDSVVKCTYWSPFGYNVLSGTYKDRDKVGTIILVEDRSIANLAIALHFLVCRC